MVRIRGLRRTLGKVLRRALGRQVSDDVKEAPQRQRPTTSAHRQQAAATVAEDERTELKLTSHGMKIEKFGRPTSEIEGIVAATGLSSLITCLLDTSDRGLLSTFVEAGTRKLVVFFYRK
ncbi:hypothetical protein HKD37_07G018965 [Glycine soja]